MMRGGGRNDGVRFAELAIDLFEALQEARQCGGTDGDVPSDRVIAVPQRAGDDLDLLPLVAGSSTQTDRRAVRRKTGGGCL
jgi:hypothetical protein